MGPCANGATCLDGVNRFSCVCPSGFSGRFCSINLDDCGGRPCLHGGRCIDQVGSFRCVCQPGYTGTVCETLLKVTPAWEGHRFQTHMTTDNRRQGRGNSSYHGDRLLVTVSERGGGLSEVQLVILLILVTITLGAVALTSALILHGRCRHRDHASCCMFTSMSSQKQQQSRRQGRSDQEECRISFLNVAEAEKKKPEAM